MCNHCDHRKFPTKQKFLCSLIFNPINLFSSSINTQMFSRIFGSTILRRPVVSLSMDSYFNKKEFEPFLLKVQYAQKQTNSTTVQKQTNSTTVQKQVFLLKFFGEKTNLTTFEPMLSGQFGKCRVLSP